MDTSAALLFSDADTCHGDLMRMLRVLRTHATLITTVMVLVIVLVLTATDRDTASRILATLWVGGVIVWTVVGMIRQVMRGHVGLDILAVVAMVATLAVGEYIASLIIVLMLAGGDALERLAGRRATRELTALLDRSPRIGHRVRRAPDGTESMSDVDVDDITVGDELVVRPAEVVPVDGVLLDVTAEFDESSLTGESIPVTKRVGEAVPSGAVNGSGAVRLRAERTGEQSQYQQIITLVREAEQTRAPVERLADRFAIPFTAISLVLAVTAWGVSGDPSRFAEVLVLATPCPLLIAAPVAFLGGLSRAAKNGVILKGGAVLEQLARVRTAAFDKTGTLTSGRPEVAEVRPTEGFTASEVLGLTAAAEQYSTHALASGVVSAARARGIPVATATDAAEVATNGVTALVGGRRVVVGKPSFVAEAAPALRRLELPPGRAAVYVAVDGRFAGTLILVDPAREESAWVVRWLRAEGIDRIAMLTGDVGATGTSIAHQVGITEIHAELHPEEKVHLAARLRPRPLMMVGDGVNDAPVLAAADVGIAMGARGATAAGQAADAVVLVDSLTGVVDGVTIARHTVRVAVTAIGIGIVLSVGLMLVAMTGAIPAVAGALIQEAVDLATILYALRAVTGRLPERPDSWTGLPAARGGLEG
ncbi:heavy metal translocating P-type ATPase [Microbacterium aquimaris]|nr:heavy metal translocating P-type ATPase [Microbacterium aquimaris]MDZ8276607.1 heavy metal translocating P-type ATPase [Microbacterium aquimaris]